MMKPVEFDELDEAIVSLLQNDGRLSNRAVARELGLTESSIRKRMKRLTESGAISYGLIVDVAATGMNVAGWLAVEVESSRARKVANFIKAMPQCSLCCLTTGEASIRAYIYAEDMEALAKTTRSISSKEGVTDVKFRESVGYVQHRYEMIMFPDSPVTRWAVDPEKSNNTKAKPRARRS